MNTVAQGMTEEILGETEKFWGQPWGFENTS
jgi:hypothetical protein